MGLEVKTSADFGIGSAALLPCISAEYFKRCKRVLESLCGTFTGSNGAAEVSSIKLLQVNFDVLAYML